MKIKYLFSLEIIGKLVYIMLYMMVYIIIPPRIPWGSVVKKLAAVQESRCRFDPWVGRIP